MSVKHYPGGIATKNSAINGLAIPLDLSRGIAPQAGAASLGRVSNFEYETSEPVRMVPRIGTGSLSLTLRPRIARDGPLGDTLMVRTKADLPFTLDMLGHQVRFELDDNREHIVATCDELPKLRVRSPVTDHAVRDASLEVMKLAAEKVQEGR